MMMGSWMGSDFTNDDLVKESTLLDDYSGEYSTPEKPDPDLYYVKLKPKKGTVSLWGAIDISIRRSDLMPLREDYYDEKSRLMRTMEFSDIRPLGGRLMPCLMKMVPLSDPGHSTTIRYLKAEFDVALPADTFTLRNLQRRR
jgi:outer membrane lipoprotein-sorting protein